MPDWGNFVLQLQSSVDRLLPVIANSPLALALGLAAPIVLAVLAKQWLAACTTVLLSCVAGVALLDASRLAAMIVIFAYIGGWLAVMAGVLGRRRIRRITSRLRHVQSRLKHVQSEVDVLRQDIDYLIADRDRRLLADIKEHRSSASEPAVAAPGP